MKDFELVFGTEYERQRFLATKARIEREEGILRRKGYRPEVFDRGFGYITAKQADEILEKEK